MEITYPKGVKLSTNHPVLVDHPADQALVMFSLSSSYHYHLYRGACNMRKSFNGLYGLVLMSWDAIQPVEKSLCSLTAGER